MTNCEAAAIAAYEQATGRTLLPSVGAAGAPAPIPRAVYTVEAAGAFGRPRRGACGPNAALLVARPTNGWQRGTVARLAIRKRNISPAIRRAAATALPLGPARGSGPVPVYSPSVALARGATSTPRMTCCRVIRCSGPAVTRTRWPCQHHAGRRDSDVIGLRLLCLRQGSAFGSVQATARCTEA